MKEQMTKKEIIELYISDLKNIVFDSPARDNRIKMLEDELDHLTAEQGCKHSKIKKVQLAKINEGVLQCVDCGQTIEKAE